MTFWMDVQYSYLMFLICTSRQGFYMSLTNANINNTVHHGYSCTEWRSLLCSCCWWKRYGVKGKVGRLCICCVVVWLVLVYGKIWGQLEKSTPPLLFPLRRSKRYVLAFYISWTASRRFLSLSLMISASACFRYQSNKLPIWKVPGQ